MLSQVLDGEHKAMVRLLLQTDTNLDTPAYFCALSGHFFRFYLRFQSREVKLLVWHVPFLMIVPSKYTISLLQPSPLQTPLSHFSHFF